MPARVSQYYSRSGGSAGEHDLCSPLFVFFSVFDEHVSVLYHFVDVDTREITAIDAANVRERCSDKKLSRWLHIDCAAVTRTSSWLNVKQHVAGVTKIPLTEEGNWWIYYENITTFFSDLLLQQIKTCINYTARVMVSATENLPPTLASRQAGRKFFTAKWNYHKLYQLPSVKEGWWVNERRDRWGQRAIAYTPVPG